MDDPSTLRRKAARFFEKAVSSTTAQQEAKKLNEVGRQLELWADDLEEIDDPHGQKASEPENDSQRRTDSQPR